MDIEGFDPLNPIDLNVPTKHPKCIIQPQIIL